MYILVSILLVASLAVVAFEDIKHLGVSWPVFPILCAIAIWNGYLHAQQDVFWFMGINSIVIVAQFLGLLGYNYMKERTTDIINTKIGAGDFLFLFAIAALFHPVYFLLFEIIALIVILIVVLATGKRKVHIPLAGYMSVLLIGCLLINYCFKVNPYNPEPFLALMV